MEGNGRLGADIVETTDEEGQVHVFEKIDEYEFEGRRYALLIYQNPEAGHVHGEGCSHGKDEKPSSEDEGYDEEIVVMRVVQEAEGEVFEAIEDEAEFERVVKMIEAAGQDDEEPGALP